MPQKSADKAGSRSRSKRNSVSALLLSWYDGHARLLPWRAPPGERADPYQVWLSEIMLQQTTVAAVGPYFGKFVQAWPSVEDLAAASLDDVLTAWAGLGYYSRARNLHACAQTVAKDLDGRFPDTEKELLALPGIGPYTAAAIASIAFGRRANVVDGNVERVTARLFAVDEPLPHAKSKLKECAASLLPDERYGDYAQAVMDLGATICTPRSPKCLLCPVMSHCEARRLGIEADLPRRAPKKERPVRYGAAFWAVRADGAVLLRRRPEKGLLGGMMEVPSSPWVEQGFAEDDPLVHAPLRADWQQLDGSVSHTFTHFHLDLDVFAAQIKKPNGVDGLWVAPDDFHLYALPSVMKKIVRLAQSVSR